MRSDELTAIGNRISWNQHWLTHHAISRAMGGRLECQAASTLELVADWTSAALLTCRRRREAAKRLAVTVGGWLWTGNVELDSGAWLFRMQRHRPARPDWRMLCGLQADINPVPGSCVALTPLVHVPPKQDPPCPLCLRPRQQPMGCRVLVRPGPRHPEAPASPSRSRRRQADTFAHDMEHPGVPV